MRVELQEAKELLEDSLKYLNGLNSHKSWLLWTRIDKFLNKQNELERRKDEKV